jgi:hypothetical protein
MRFKILPIILLSFGCGLAASGQTIKKKKWWNLDSLASKNLRFIPIPTLSASPETGIKAGLSLDYFYRVSKKDTSTRVSFSWLSVSYSTRKQLNVDGYTSTFTAGEKYFFGFRGGYVNNYERYWGTSYENSHQDHVDLKYQRLFASGRVTRNVGKRRFIGLEYYYSNYYNLEVGDNFPIHSSLPLVNSSEVGGAGVAFNIDRRDNQFSPEEGMYLDINNSYFFDLRNGGYLYRSLNFDGRKYLKRDKHVFAVQSVFQHFSDGVTMLEKHRFGGANVMRGFFQGRFRDNNLWALQTEYRYQLSNLIKLAAFASAGSTAPDLSSIFTNRVHFSGGTGLRFLFNKAKKVYLRGDVAVTSLGNIGYYFRIGDAF